MAELDDRRLIALWLDAADGEHHAVREAFLALRYNGIFSVFGGGKGVGVLPAWGDGGAALLSADLNRLAVRVDGEGRGGGLAVGAGQCRASDCDGGCLLFLRHRYLLGGGVARYVGEDKGVFT